MALAEEEVAAQSLARHLEVLLADPHHYCLEDQAAQDDHLARRMALQNQQKERKESWVLMLHYQGLVTGRQQNLQVHQSWLH